MGEWCQRPGRLTTILMVAIGSAGLDADHAIAQSIRPVVVEYREKARSKFELVNDSLLPVRVVLEPKSFTITAAGQAIFRDLDPRIRLRLSAMTLRIPAHQSRWVFYEAETDSLPAWFTIYATFTCDDRGDGLRVEVELPHTVYLLQKHPLEEADVRLTLLGQRGADPVMRVAVDNLGDRLGRVREAMVRAGGREVSLGGFPLTPHGRRILEFRLPGNEAAGDLNLTFANFSRSLPLVMESVNR
ncbi:MAG: hypothetical protein FD129_1900, partial [bacterium]